jgi:hypothetical protein
MVFFQVAPLAWSRVPFSGVAVGSEGLASGDVDGDGNWDLFGSNWTGHPPVRLFENLSSAAPSGPLGLYTTSPCRLVDTGIPGTARALSANLVITQPTAAGYLTLAPGGSPRPPTSILNYVAAQTRANEAIVRLSGTGQFDAWCTQASGTAHLVIDVNGWFE